MTLETAMAPKKRILFVDDNEMIANSGKLLLEARGFQVTLAQNGEEALDLFKADSQSFDLIFSDLTMPKMNGLDLSLAIRQISKTVPIIITSGNLDTPLDSKFKSVGLDAYISKPWSVKELLEMIASLLPD